MRLLFSLAILVSLTSPLAAQEPKALEAIRAGLANRSLSERLKAAERLAALAPEARAKLLAKLLPSDAVAGDKLQAQIATLIGQLSDPAYRKRERASVALMRIGRPALEALQRAAAGKQGTLEGRNRARVIAEQIQAAAGAGFAPGELARLLALHDQPALLARLEGQRSSRVLWVRLPLETALLVHSGLDAPRSAFAVAHDPSALLDSWQALAKTRRPELQPPRAKLTIAGPRMRLAYRHKSTLALIFQPAPGAFASEPQSGKQSIEAQVSERWAPVGRQLVLAQERRDYLRRRAMVNDATDDDGDLRANKQLAQIPLEMPDPNRDDSETAYGRERFNTAACRPLGLSLTRLLPAELAPGARVDLTPQALAPLGAMLAGEFSQKVEVASGWLRYVGVSRGKPPRAIVAGPLRLAMSGQATTRYDLVMRFELDLETGKPTRQQLLGVVEQLRTDGGVFGGGLWLDEQLTAGKPE